MGRFIESTKLLEIINYVENRETHEYEEILLPVEFIPGSYKRGPETKGIPDVLASYTTYFKTDTRNNINRGINIDLQQKALTVPYFYPAKNFHLMK